MERSFQAGDILLGKYRVEHVLGRGGMGLVLAVRHIELGQLFALKVLLPAAQASASAVERFVREARAAARLKSEHVAKVVDVGRLEDGAPYMVMEYLEGSDLAAVLRSRGALPLAEAIEYLLPACEAIAEAHAAGIVHRDIKPANLFLARRANGSASVKVLDFGISKHSEADSIELTQTGAMLGSPLYMAPEQIRSTRAVDARGDIWSMGVVLYKLVTGVTPFRRTAAHELLVSVLEDEPTPPSSVRPGLPPELDAIILRALQKKPELRFQSIDELAAALVALSRGQAISLPPVAAPPPVAEAGVTPQPSSEATVSTLEGSSVEAAHTSRKRAYRLVLGGGVAALMIFTAGFFSSRAGTLAGSPAAPGAPPRESSTLADSSAHEAAALTREPPSHEATSAPPATSAVEGQPSPNNIALAPTSSTNAGAAPASSTKWAPRSRTAPPPSAAAAPSASTKPRTIF